MEKEFVPYEQALALKELGFDEPCILLYRGLDTQPVCQMGYEFKTEKNSDYNDEINYWLTVPTYSQAFRWFREKYGLISYVHPLALLQDTKKWCYEITNFESSWDEYSDLHTLEEAELACLLELINICKKK